MFLKQSKNHKGRIHLDFFTGYRKGKSVKQKYVESIGYLDELEKIYEDPIAHFKAIAKERTKAESNEPIIIDPNVKLNSDSLRKNLGYGFLQIIYHELSINEFCKKLQKKSNIDYKINNALRLLTYTRILQPSSIKSTFEKKEVYFENFDLSLKDTYRSLDVLLPYKDQLIKHLYEKLKEMKLSDTTITYYDCTNYYFEIDFNDRDEFNDNGEVVKTGLRKRGPSKENRRDPIVGMGLLLDTNGIPLSYDIFPGNESEKVTLRPLLNQVKSSFNLSKVIVVADRGLNTSDNIFFNNNEYNGYIYSKSVRGADKEFKQWVLDGFDGDDNMKSRIHTFDIKLEKGNKGNTKTTVIQKQVVYYSQKYAERTQHNREETLAKAKDLIANPGKYTRASGYGALGYIKNIKFNKETGEIINRDLSLDFELIEEEAKYDGYYAIVTSETKMADDDIVSTYRGLWMIEDAFKVMKSDFKARPVYLSLDDHIKAHFLICYLALVIARILEAKLNHNYPLSRIIESLNKYSCSHLQQNYYMFDYRDPIIEDLESLYSLDLTKKYMSQSEIRKILRAK